MQRKRHKGGFFQAIKKRWTSVKSVAFEEQLPDNFFEVVGQRAATNAINENKALNLPVTLVRNGWVTREMPDGTRQQITKIQVKSTDEYRARNLVKGAVIHVGKKP